MKRESEISGDGVAQASLPRQWEMAGVHGQHLGFVDALGIDFDSGRIAYVVLATPWQTIMIPWDRVQLDRRGDRLQLLPSRAR